MLLLFAGCESARRAGESAAFQLNPVGSTQVLVSSVASVGPYLAADLRGPSLALRLLAPESAACAQVLAPEARVVYAKSGLYGRVSRGDASCDAVGVLSLAAWRDRQPRRPGTIVPRATARYALVSQDEKYLILRGRFGLASLVGIPAGYDLMAITANDPTCRTVAAKGEASLEFRPAGPDPYRLLAGNAVCVVQGFATPPPDAAQSAPTP